MDASYRKHYGFASVKNSLLHFLLGKAFTAISSLAVLLLLVRQLSVPEYAALVLLQAMVLVAGVLATLGVTQTALRFVPALRTQGNNQVMYRLICASLAYRGLAAGVLLGLVWLAQPYLGSWFNLGVWSGLLIWYLAVGWLRLMNFYLAQLLESLLWQKSSQYSLALSSVAKLALIAWIALAHELTLPEVVQVELVCEGLSALLLAAALWRGWRRDPDRKQGERTWFAQNRQRMRRYGLWGYLQTVSNALYGSAPNRLFAGRFVSVGDLGLFGFVSALADMGQRYLPTRMLQGMIRPLFFARFARNSDFTALVQWSEFNFRVSLLLLALPGLVLLVAGEPLLYWLTAGKYGQAAYLLAAYSGVLALESLWSQMELLAQTAEKNHLLVAGNLILSASLLLALPLVAALGLWSLVMANAAGNLLAIAWIASGLRREGFPVKLEWARLAKLCALLLLSAAAGALASRMLHSPAWGAAMALICLAGAVVRWPPFSPVERDMLKKLLDRERFGMLASRKGEAL